MNTKTITDQVDQAAAMMVAGIHELARALQLATQPGRQQVLAIDEATVDAEALQLDAAFLHAAPIVAAPAICEFFPMQENGHRFVIGAGGLYLEVRRPWLHFIHCIGPVTDVTIPYGAVEPRCDMAFGRVGHALPELRDFAVHAVAEAPNEAGAFVLWNSVTDTWRIEYPEARATTSSLTYTLVEPGPDEHVVIDLHSHGALPAFFSETDDRDDAGSVKIAGVYGNLDTSTPTVCFRICVLGLTIPLTVPVARIFE
jgi:PRTRC genetic system protein A